MHFGASFGLWPLFKRNVQRRSWSAAQCTKIVILFSLVVCFIDLRQKHVFCQTILRSWMWNYPRYKLYLSYAGFIPQMSPLLVSLLEERKLACNSYYNILSWESRSTEENFQLHYATTRTLEIQVVTCGHLKAVNAITVPSLRCNQIAARIKARIPWQRQGSI